MKKIVLTFSLLFSFFSFIQSQEIVKEITLTEAGTLSSLLTEQEKQTITSLKLSGPINEWEFDCMNIEMTALTTIDLESTVWYDSDFEFEIPEMCFSSKTTLKSIILPETLLGIGANAFVGCTNLTGELVLPETLSYIREDAFSGTAISSVRSFAAEAPELGSNALGSVKLAYIPDGTKDSYQMASGWSELVLVDFGAPYLTIHVETPGTLTEVIAKEGLMVTSINKLKLTGTLNDLDFRYYRSMVNVYDLDLSELTNTEFPVGVFAGSGNLFFIKLPAHLESVSANAFAGCSNLKKIELPASVTYIADCAFIACNSINEVFVLPENLTYLGASAFAGCTSLPGVVMPQGITAINNLTFAGCSKLTGEFVIPEQVTTIGESAFGGCTGITAFNMSNNISHIGKSAFTACGIQGAVVLPNNLDSISAGLFQNCYHLTEVTIPASVKGIQMNAFNDCANLQIIHCLSDVAPTLEDEVFGNVNKETCTVYVPNGCIEAYRNASEQWNEFLVITGNQLEELSTIHVWSINNELTIEGPEMNRVEIYNINGTIEAQSELISDCYTVNVISGMTYIVKIYKNNGSIEVYKIRS